MSQQKIESLPNLQFFKTKKKNLEFEVFPLQSLFSRNEKLPVPVTVPQRLQFFNIMFITKGSGVHFIDFEPHEFSAGDLVFVSKGQAQAFRPSETHDGYLMLFTERFLSKNLIDSDVPSFYRLYNYHLQSPIVRPSKNEFPIFSNLVAEILNEYQSDEVFEKEEVLRLLLKLFLLKAERIKRTPNASEKNSDSFLKFGEFQNYLEKNISETRNAKDYAGMMHISYKHLNEISKAITGSTAKEVIDNYLVLEIKRNLAVSDISVKELAYKLGFDEPTNFVKYFKRQTTQTPIQFKGSLAS
ncbi:MAG: helix-turn-helix transcriptional regulator [Chloroflexota bacterium]